MFLFTRLFFHIPVAPYVFLLNILLLLISNSDEAPSVKHQSEAGICLDYL